MKLLGRVRNHFSHQVRIATRNELENSASDDPDSTLFQDLFNLTINGYDEEDGYKAAKPIYSSLCLYRNTSKNNRGTLRNGDMTVFACSFLNNKLVQDLLSLSEEAFVLLCLRKELVRSLHDKDSQVTFKESLREKIVDHPTSKYVGSLDDLIVHAKDGFRSEEIQLFLKLKAKLKLQRRSEKKKDEQVSKFYFQVTEHASTTRKAKRRRTSLNMIEIDSADENLDDDGSNSDE